MTAIWWIRRTLRLTDNPALFQALSNHKQVIPLFIHDPAFDHFSKARFDFLFDGLHELDKSLQAIGSRLIFRRGNPLDVLTTLVNEHTVSAIYACEDFSPFAKKRDDLVRQTLPLTTTAGIPIRHPNSISKKAGGTYTVFTPYSKTWKAQPLPQRHDILPAPEKLSTPDVASYPIPEFSRSPYFPAGEAEARRRVDAFVAKGIGDYNNLRDRTDLNGTAKLSPYLKFGMVSARELAVLAIETRAKTNNVIARQGADTWLNELIWRDFYISILHHFPHVNDGNFRPVYDNIQWHNDEAEFAAWCAGQTGYPIVDAAMRQLNETGWMHNRARMIVASFLVKDLLIDWRWGEKYFMEKLLGGDTAANNGGWQWAAGTGTDAAPYFRIFNPISQGQKHDPNGEYVRKWCPELTNVPDKFLHAPWLMPPLDQQMQQVVVGRDYPAPIVDHKFARERTLAAYKAAREA